MTIEKADFWNALRQAAKFAEPVLEADVSAFYFEDARHDVAEALVVPLDTVLVKHWPGGSPKDFVVQVGRERGVVEFGYTITTSEVIL